MSLFIEWPLLAVLPCLVFLGLYSRSRRRSILVAGIAWLAYAVYELGMHQRWLCSGECNIRVDLLLIYPMLLLASLFGVVAIVRRPGKVDG
jgi:hypothetical protein